METNKSFIYLIPNTLGEYNVEKVLPLYNFSIIKTLDVFIVEDVRSARRFLRKCGFENNFDDVIFFELNKHTPDNEIDSFVNPIFNGKSIGLISEAGCPAIADPGAKIVEIAHNNSIKVVPLVGPSSLLLALMASGFNGQNFAFNGYLPIDKRGKINAIKNLEKESILKSQTQIFIETPYRNDMLFEMLINVLNSDTRLCIAKNLTLENEYVKTLSINQWKKQKIQIGKNPTVFLIYANN